MPLPAAARPFAVAALSLLAAAGLAVPAQARTIVVPATGSTAAIQSAVDAASPGDTIRVSPGVYTGATVHVATDHLTIRGSTNAIVDATGHDFGITVGTPDIPNIPPSCGTPSPVYATRDFTIDGLTVRNAEDTGIFLMAVDGFRVTGGRYLDNGEYGIFPRCSRDGLIDRNSGGGGDDATIYVGVDDGITVEHNNLSGGRLGIELEDTRNSIVRNNVLSGNTVGIFVIVLPGLPTTLNEHALIEDNVVQRNNLPNPLPIVTCLPPDYQSGPPGCVPLEDDLQLLPSGSGILNVGGHDVTIRGNTVNNNDTAGVGVVFNPFGFGSSLNTTITRNTIRNNGRAPDPRSVDNQGNPAYGDIVYLDDPTNGSCLSRNSFGTLDAPFGAPPTCG